MGFFQIILHAIDIRFSVASTLCSSYFARHPCHLHSQHVGSINSNMRIGRDSKEKVAAESVFYPFGHFFPAMPNTTLLEDEHSSLLWLNVEIIFVVRDSSGPSLDSILAKVDLESYARFPSVWQAKLSIAVPSEIVSFSVS